MSQAQKLGYRIDKIADYLLEMTGGDADRCTGGSA